jgi:hypothetical protein
MGHFYILTNISQKMGQSNEIIEIVIHAGEAFNPNLVYGCIQELIFRPKYTQL